MFISLVATTAVTLVPTGAASAQGAGNTEVAHYMEAGWDGDIARGMPYPASAPRVLLHGSWSEMGEQY